MPSQQRQLSIRPTDHPFNRESLFEGCELRDYPQTTSREKSYLTHQSKCQMDFGARVMTMLFIICSLFVHLVFIICSLFHHSFIIVYIICSLFVHYVFTICSLFVHDFIIRSLLVHYLFTICAQVDHHVFIICSLFVHYLFTICSSFVHYFIIRSLFVHYLLIISQKPRQLEVPLVST